MPLPLFLARLSKLAMVAALAAFALLVAWNNLVDYGSNFAFVAHVLSMDTTFPDTALRHRAITAPALWHAGYGLIILGEALTGLAFAASAVLMARGLRGPGFAAAKGWAQLGAALGVLVWFLGFQVIGGEWFLMWQSATWNGQEAAFRFTTTILLVTLYVVLPESFGGAAGRRDRPPPPG
ncbi:DUF2165 family protein [Pseudoroseomonas cervicalis]|uniref:Small integral membrane protein n=1 Tax=Pseudoroseomonas cervicalis ATCC 49957 TaxID=525371 RepID=D5RHI1_9PROT|nr:DUF2165 domain-containing protein [Pseudoroseomonas cervicalis]EFH13233.1 hypothetical protein HMPREF0731_0540 [Pseudoroseomonas cervicalis ATCC 49957]